MNRWKAAALHFALSLLVIGSLATAIFLLWYPMGLRHVSALDELFLLMLGIDVTAGPLLTLLVFDRRKPGLRRDLIIIALLQLAFLGYGLYTAWISRPVFLVGNADRIDVVYAREIDAHALAKAGVPAARSLPWNGPTLVGATLPDDPKVQESLMLSAFMGGKDVQTMPERYVPYPRVAAKLLESAAPAALAAEPGSQQERLLQDAIAATGRKASELSVLLVMSGRGSGSMLVDSRTAMPLRVVPINAYEARRIAKTRARAAGNQAP